MTYDDYYLDKLQDQIEGNHAIAMGCIYELQADVNKLMEEIDLFNEIVGQAQADIEELYHNLGYTESRLKIVEAKLDSFANKPRPVSNAKTEKSKRKTDLEIFDPNILDCLFNIDSEYKTLMEQLGAGL